jgi:aminopeptidase-like protein
VDFLEDKGKLLFLERNRKEAIKSNRKLHLVIKSYGEDNGKYWVRRKYDEMNINKIKKQAYVDEWAKFNYKYRDPKTYFWISTSLGIHAVS